MLQLEQFFCHPYNVQRSPYAPLSPITSDPRWGGHARRIWRYQSTLIPSSPIESKLSKPDMLFRLPDEILLAVAGYLHSRDLLAFSLISRRLRDLSATTILFWTHAVTPALLNHLSFPHAQSPQDLRQAVKRCAMNRLTNDTGKLVPYRTTSVHLCGALYPGTEQVVPGTQFLLGLLEEAGDQSTSLVCIDLKAGRLIEKIGIDGHPSQCLLSTETISATKFRVAVYAQFKDMETRSQKRQVSLFTVDLTQPNSVQDHNVTTTFALSYRTGLLDSDAGGLSFPIKMILHRDVVLLQETFADEGVRIIAFQLTENVTKVHNLYESPSGHCSWEVVGDSLVCYGAKEGLQMIKLPSYTCVAPTRRAPATQGFAAITDKGEDTNEIVSFDRASWDIIKDNDHPVMRIPGLVYDKEKRTIRSIRVRLSTAPVDSGPDTIELDLGHETPIQIQLDKLLYTSDTVWGTDECSLYISPGRVKDGAPRELKKLPGVDLGCFELVEPTAGVVCVGRFEPDIDGLGNVATCMDVYWYTPI
ncbi:hypothetical protein CPB86DRAFT_870246 [Serendipita vermifera]|nr:hypothetical protein CPB86DRAFT_870246 [Serendipita vermifera]